MGALLIAGTHSGVGKTTVTMGILAALSKRHPVQAYKVGPDYLDPTFHTFITGRKSRNLDNVMMGDEEVREIFDKTGIEDGANIIEGAMGLFDGAMSDPARGSGASIAKVLGCQVLLVVDGTGISHSLAALVRGYQLYDPQLEIAGVLINRVSSAGHYELLKHIVETGTGIRCYGYLGKNQPSLPSRHLGLIPSSEIEDLEDKVEALAQSVSQSVDLDGLMALMELGTKPNAEMKTDNSDHREFKHLHEFGPTTIPPSVEEVNIGVAMDAAFSFYYEDNLDLLRSMGARIVPFSPMNDPGLPEGLDAIYLGGGYPEVYAKQLADNRSMKASLLNALEAGIPYFAECGGFMYLCGSLTTLEGEHREMVGWFPGNAVMTRGLKRFGYKRLKLKMDCVLGAAGESIRVHEFHHSDVADMGMETEYELVKHRFDATTITENCGYIKGNGVAGYPHFHFYGNKNMAKQFIEKASEYKLRRRR